MTSGPRIISLLPSATEMICALGVSEQLVGVTHECDFPAIVRSKPAVVRNALPIESMTQRAIDNAVTERLRSGLGLYVLDIELIQKLRPDIIVTQSLCDVCAPSENEIAQLLASLEHRPRVIFQTPRTLGEILDCVDELGRELGRRAEAQRLIEDAQLRLSEIAFKVASTGSRPRVFCMEWSDPVYCSGHWVPEIVQLAGGHDWLGRQGTDSVRIKWGQVLDFAPEVLVFMPCGYDLDRTIAEAKQLTRLPGFRDLPACRQERVYAVDANAFFARPGPRVVEGAELMAHLLHPDVFASSGLDERFRPIECEVEARPREALWVN